MRWVAVTHQALALSTTGDCALLDPRSGRIAATHRACPRATQYRPAAPAGCCGGRCRRLPALRPVACRLAYQPRLIRAGRDPARLAADRAVRPAPAGPDMGDRELGPLLDDAYHHPAGRTPDANRPIQVFTPPELSACRR